MRSAVRKTGKVLAFILLASWLTAVAVPAHAADDRQELVDRALATFNDFMGYPNMNWFRELIPDAEGVLIIPSMYEGGLLFGGFGGKGVVIARDRATGGWQGPSFCNIGGGSIGLQVGGQESEIILLAMTPVAVDALKKLSFKLGTDASVAAGPVGAGAEGSVSIEAAFLSFSRSKGLFAGLTFEGALIKADEDANRQYYRMPITPAEVLSGQGGANPGAAQLISAVARAATKAEQAPPTP